MTASFGLTDTGRQRELNEDRILIDPALNVFAVADGMGGQAYGERAAEIAVQSIKNYFQTTAGRKEITWPFGYDATIDLAQNLMLTAIRLANRRIWREAETATQYTSMGCTLAAAYISGDQAVIGSAGDSRVYLYRDQNLKQITRDDSLIARLLESGAITLAEAATHPQRSVVTEAAGAKETINVQLYDVALKPDDRLMLTSDGVHGVLEASVLRDILAGGGTVQSIVEKIVGKANELGGPDNISCIVVEYK